MKTRGFTAVETLLTLGIIAVTTGISMPLYRNYQARSDLDIAVEQVVSALHRAQVLAQSGEQSASWGYAVQEGVLFAGESYAVRAPSLDESFPIPVAINASGLPEVTFAPVSGIPNQAGEIVLENAIGDRQIITISSSGLFLLSGILPPVTEEFPGGDSLSSATGSSGSETGGSSAGAGTSEGGETGGSSAGGAGGSEGGDEGGSGDSSASGGETSSVPTCTDRFTVSADGTIETTGSVDATVTVLGSAITYGVGGPKVKVTVSASTDGGDVWTPLFSGNAVNGGEKETIENLPEGAQLALRMNGRHSWLFNKTYTSNDQSGHVEVLRNGDTPPAVEAFAHQASLENFLKSILDAEGKIHIDPYDVVILTELGSLGTSSSDFQDAVLLVHFEAKSGSCAQTGDAKMKIIFERLENTGQGDVARRVYVGSQAIAFSESQWIPLTINGTAVVDSGLVEAVPGIAVSRQAGVVRLLLHGSLLSGKEIVDARVVFDYAQVQSTDNDTGQNAMESPFDDVVNDGPGGDEVDTATDGRSVLVQTRVTFEDDAVFLYWQKAAGTSSASSAGQGSSASGTPAGSAGSSQSSTAASQQSQSSFSSASAGGGEEGGESSVSTEPPDPCAASYMLDANGRIVLLEPADVTFDILGSSITYGTNGPKVQVRFNTSFDDGKTWQSLFGFRAVNGGESQRFTDMPAGSKIALQVEGRYSWLFRRTARSGDGQGRIKLFKREEAAPATAPFRQGKLKKFLSDMLSDGKVHVGKRQLLVLAELQDIGDASDYQDGVVVITLEKPASQGICGTQTDESEEDVGSSSSTGGNASSTTGQMITICHFPPENRKSPLSIEVDEAAWAAHAAHGDRLGPCEEDQDGDSVSNAEDLCPGTFFPESVPTEFMLFDRYALTANSDIFRVGPRKKVSQYSLDDTRGCSCEQLVDVAEGVRDYHFNQFPSLQRQMRSLFPFYTEGARRFGCGKAILDMARK
ncbi:MAG: hypothetical protein PHI23_01905 [Candidatus Peribacteraceae bacterium]|nr:hypothetical protein [Candidatus Peribacteraceae bacterium]